MTERKRGTDSRLRPSLLPDEARLIQEVIHDYSGLSYGIDSGFFLERRLAPRLDELGLSTYTEYYHYLRYDPAGPRELEDMVEKLTTHETYFFREQYQLDAFRIEMLPELVERLGDRRRLTVWSAGCSTGEEAYTLAILLHEDRRLRGWNIRVVGSDISRKVVSHARMATYGPSSFRTTPQRYQSEYFTASGGQFTVRDVIRNLCSFGQVNLMTTDRFPILGECDVIFCRNVLMYLSAEARVRIVKAFHETLRPGGYLLLGHSESLLNITSRFDLVHLSRDLVYRRPL